MTQANPSTDQHDRSAFQRDLLAWFATAARDLPWRHTRDPYRVLVSEVMLQQTQVDRVIAKYHAFLQAFPDLESLANAPTAEVIRLWAGLGYNRRAVNLQRTARVVIEQHGGRFPNDVAVLRQLPGVGAYTAGAVACFAFEQDVAFMDTNIKRVLRRSLVGSEQAEPPTTERELLALGLTVVPPGQGWVWNQAIMELGALICTAQAPTCWRCPVQAHCRAYAAWRTADETVFAPTAAVGPATRKRPVRQVTERREERYIGSPRYYRGRIVEVLRGLASGETIPFLSLGPLLKPDYTPADEAWLHDLVARLERDGLVETVDKAVCLPQA